MRVTVRLFARLRELAGTGELPVEVPDGSTVETVWKTLVAAHPNLAAHAGSLSAAVNEEYAKPSARVADGDEVAFLPPVSGGWADESKGFTNQESGSRDHERRLNQRD